MSSLTTISFLNERIGTHDVIGFNRDLLLFTRARLHRLKTLRDRAAADELGRTKEVFTCHCSRVRARRAGAGEENAIYQPIDQPEASGEKVTMD